MLNISDREVVNKCCQLFSRISGPWPPKFGRWWKYRTSLLWPFSNKLSVNLRINILWISVYKNSVNLKKINRTGSYIETPYLLPSLWPNWPLQIQSCKRVVWNKTKIYFLIVYCIGQIRNWCGCSEAAQILAVRDSHLRRWTPETDFMNLWTIK